MKETNPNQKNNRPNVDPEEIKKFDDFANDWWNPNGKMKPLHLMNPLRLTYIQQNTTLKNQSIIDIGCGGGLLSEVLAKAGAMVTAIDMSAEVLDIAKQHAKQNKLAIDYQQTTADTFAKNHHEQFDIVTCMELLEHVPNPETLIKDCYTLLKPGGQVFFSTLNRNPKSFLMAIVGAEYILNMLPKGTHDYQKFIRPAELCAWARKANLTLKGLQGIHYNVLNGEFSLKSNIDVNYLACFEKKIT